MGSDHTDRKGRPVEFMFMNEDRIIQDGDEVISFRGETWTFIRVSRNPNGSSTGRVEVKSSDPARNMTSGTREFYPSVFNGTIVPVMECPAYCGTTVYQPYPFGEASENPAGYLLLNLNGSPHTCRDI
jgi:hypothetical protein